MGPMAQNTRSPTARAGPPDPPMFAHDARQNRRCHPKPSIIVHSESAPTTGCVWNIARRMDPIAEITSGCYAIVDDVEAGRRPSEDHPIDES